MGVIQLSGLFNLRFLSLLSNSKTRPPAHTACAGLHLFSFVVSQLYNLNLLSFTISVTTTHSNIYKWRVTWHNIGCGLSAIREAFSKWACPPQELGDLNCLFKT